MNASKKTDEVLTSWKSRVYDSYVSSGQAGPSSAGTNDIDPDRFFSGRASHIRNVISRHVTAGSDGRILDLACGHGAYLYFLRKAGYTNARGVDVSPEQVALAHTLGITAVECRDILSFLGDTKSNSVDVVLMIDLLEHLIPVELFAVLDEVFRVLTPRGTCIAHVPNAEGLFGMRVRYGDLTHERAFAPKSAKQLFNTIGFVNVACFEDRPETHSLKSFIRRFVWICGTMPHRLLLSAETGAMNFILSQNMLITARKS
jgi:2-polyprenyl-3-methyl-5-hydroxy-6-metoxy-1,4-benzoquinol methylase